MPEEPEENVQSILRCELCHKLFDKHSALKRHGYYCRSRRAGAGASARPRSCISCARAKSGCDNRQPKCLRCMKKAIQCHYPTNVPKGTGPRILQFSDTATQPRDSSSSFTTDFLDVENHQESSGDGTITSDSAFVISNPEFGDFGGGDLDWDDLNIDFLDFSNAPMYNNALQYPASASSSLTPHSTRLIDPTIQTRQVASSYNASIPTLPTHNSRLFIQRPKMRTGAQRTATLMFHTLKSYPHLMLRHNSLPSFIHPSSISPNVNNNDMEPLTNCISLVHMIGSGIPGSRKLFWRNVRQECEHVCEEHRSLNKWELLAAMQALAIYILIRLDEGETDYNNLDFLLLATMNVICEEFNSLDLKRNTSSSQSAYSPEIGWKEWIFDESRRRLAVVYRALNLLVDLVPAATCRLQSDLVLAPLPSKKQLWEADGEFAWKTERDKEPRMQTAFALAGNGELVQLHADQLFSCSSMLLYQPLDADDPLRHTSTTSTAHWEEWCSEMDGFGGLVMLAASLIG